MTNLVWVLNTIKLILSKNQMILSIVKSIWSQLFSNYVTYIMTKWWFLDKFTKMFIISRVRLNTFHGIS